jgi:putative membrane protein
MKSFLIKLLVNTLALLAVVNLVPGITVARLDTAIVAALLLGLINSSLRPILLFLTLPFTIVTMGLFTLFINAFLFYLTSRLVVGFGVIDFASAFWGALFFSVISFVLNLIFAPQNSKVTIKRYAFRQKQYNNEDNIIDVEAKR